MILYGAVILVIFINKIEATRSSDEISVQTTTENGVRANEIAKLIYKINTHNSGTGMRDHYLKQLHNKFAIDVDYIGERLNEDDANSLLLEQILKRLRANEIQDSEENDEIRINFIKNPQVLEEYKDHLRKKKRESTSSESSDSDSASGLDFYRRNAMFRIGSMQRTSDSTFNNKPQRDEYNSQESYRPRGRNQEKDEMRHKKNTNDGDNEMSVEFHDRSNSKKSDSSNPWDKIVKHLKGNSDKNKDSRQDNYDKNWQDSNKKSGHNSKDKPEDSKNKYNNKNDWDRKDNDRDKNDNSWNKKESNLDKKTNNKDKFMDMDKKENDWDKKINSDDKKENSWNDWVPKTKEKLEKQRQNENRDKPRADVDNYDRNIKKDVYKEKPKNSAKDWNEKPFVPKISEYYKPRPKLMENVDRSGFKAFGRTSIPFVGKKGIYEEEVNK